MYHTGDDASHVRGNFECSCCERVITMLGNYKDKFPPCPWSKQGAYYKPMQVVGGRDNGEN